MPPSVEPMPPMSGSPAGSMQSELIATMRQAVASSPEDVDALCALAGALMRSGKWGEAAQFYRRAGKLAPQRQDIREPMARIAHAFRERASVHADRAETDQAINAYQQAIALDPGMPVETYMKLGTLLNEKKQVEEALAVWGRACERYPAHVPAYISIGNTLRTLSRLDDAIAAYRRAARADPGALAPYRHLGDLLAQHGRLDEALEACRKIRELAPDDPNSIVNEANVLELQGKVREAYDLLLPLVQAGKRTAHLAIGFGKICQRLEPPSAAALPLLQDELARPEKSAEARAGILAALSGLCNALERHDEAFAYLQQAKEINARNFDDSKEELLSVITRSRDSYTPQRLARLPRARHDSELPVFIVGMPRSGTSLAEQILSSHPQVFGAGELTTIIGLARSALGVNQSYPACFEAWSQQRVDAAAALYLRQLRDLAPQAARVTDKMPFNFLHLGLIQTLFPLARIIHCSRNPLDTCVSCYFMEFSKKLSIFNDLNTVGRYYRGYRELMQHWRGVLSLPVFELRYEKLLANPEPAVRQLLEFCGLEWNDACMKFHESKRHVKTFSYHQVRKPLYSQSVGRYKAYARHLSPLIQALGPELAGEEESVA